MPSSATVLLKGKKKQPVTERKKEREREMEDVNLVLKEPTKELAASHRMKRGKKERERERERE